MEWNDLAQDIEKWQDLVNTVMTLGFHSMSGISWLAEGLLASQEELRSGLARICDATMAAPDREYKI